MDGVQSGHHEVGSILSIGSNGSILSIGSAGSQRFVAAIPPPAVLPGLLFALDPSMSTIPPRRSQRTPLHARASVPRVVQPVVAKQGALFVLSADNGDIEEHTDQGLYFHDMRYLSACALRLNGSMPVVLLSDATDGNRQIFEMTNLDLRGEDGTVRLPKEMLAVRRDRTLAEDCIESITVESYARGPALIVLQLQYAADFADMFVVRGMHAGRRGTPAPTQMGRRMFDLSLRRR